MDQLTLSLRPFLIPSTPLNLGQLQSDCFVDTEFITVTWMGMGNERPEALQSRPSIYPKNFLSICGAIPYTPSLSSTLCHHHQRASSGRSIVFQFLLVRQTVPPCDSNLISAINQISRPSQVISQHLRPPPPPPRTRNCWWDSSGAIRGPGNYLQKQKLKHQQQ